MPITPKSYVLAYVERNTTDVVTISGKCIPKSLAVTAHEFSLGSKVGLTTGFTSAVTTTAITTTDIQLICASVNRVENTVAIYQNGTIKNSAIKSIAYAPSSTLRIFGNTSGGFVGTVGDIIAFVGAISDSDRQKLEGYLAWKYGMQGSLPSSHPYKNGQPMLT